MTEQGRIPQRVGREVQKRRVERGMSLEDLSDACGLTPAFIQQIERGQCDPSISETTALAFALGCDARDLVTSSDDVQALSMPVEPIDEAELTPRRRYN